MEQGFPIICLLRAPHMEQLKRHPLQQSQLNLELKGDTLHEHWITKLVNYRPTSLRLEVSTLVILTPVHPSKSYLIIQPKTLEYHAPFKHTTSWLSHWKSPFPPPFPLIYLHPTPRFPTKLQIHPLGCLTSIPTCSCPLHTSPAEQPHIPLTSALLRQNLGRSRASNWISFVTGKSREIKAFVGGPISVLIENSDGVGLDPLAGFLLVKYKPEKAYQWLDWDFDNFT